jgi:uncharacterized protein
MPAHGLGGQLEGHVAKSGKVFPTGSRQLKCNPQVPMFVIHQGVTQNRNPKDTGMALCDEFVLETFKGLESGDGAAFFERVADDVDWTVMGTHPLAGHYLSKKAFREGTFAKLGRVLVAGAQLHVEHLLLKGNEAIVELHSLATAKNGMRFDNRYCWVVYFRNGLIVRVRAYLDSAMVARLFEENPCEDAVGCS